MKKVLPFLLVFIFCATEYHAQQQSCTIDGYARGREGNIVGVYCYSDYITMTKKKLADAIVGDSGHFVITFPIDEVSYIFLDCHNVHAFMYAAPGKTEYVDLPDRDAKNMVNPDVDYEVPMTIFCNDSTDMNFLAIDFNEHFEKFWHRDWMYFVTKDSLQYIDTFRLKMQQHYAFVKNPYFMPWMNYTIASIEDATFHSQVKTAKNYLVGKQVYFHNAAYMEFINGFFKDYLYLWSVRTEGAKIPTAINTLINYDSLLAVAAKLPWLKNDTLRELVVMKSLFELYNNPAYNQKCILGVVQEASARSRISDVRTIARNTISFYTKLKAGTPAPHFTALSRKNEQVDPLDEFKGKYIYLFFFATWNSHAMDEFRYMADLQKKYGKQIMFVSVSLDRDTNAYKKFLKDNPKYNWTILHFDFNDKLKQDYNLYDVPAGFIIDPDGKLFVSPADNPTGDLEYSLYRIANPKAPPFVKPGDR